MTRQFLAVLLLPIFAVVGMVGCGDDEPPVVPVNPYLKFTTGDTFEFDYYDRDLTGARQDASKQVIVWAVVRTDLDTLGKDGVTEIVETRYDATGTTQTGSSKIYVLANGQGEFHQYDLMRTVMDRFSGGVDLSTYLDSIPKVWVQVGDTKSASAVEIEDLAAGALITKALNDVTVATFTFDAQIKMGIRSQHLGKTSVTVPAGTYASAYSTDNFVRVNLSNTTPITVGPITLPPGSTLVNDSVNVHYDLDVEDGPIRQQIESKALLVAGLYPLNINGSEMELTSSTRASVD